MVAASSATTCTIVKSLLKARMSMIMVMVMVVVVMEMLTIKSRRSTHNVLKVM